MKAPFETPSPKNAPTSIAGLRLERKQKLAASGSRPRASPCVRIT
jgi:hypothetical protein